MQTIILDTNFIATAIRFKIDVFGEIKKLGKFQIAILDKSLEELKKLKENKIALALLKKNNVKVIKTTSEKDVDSLLVELADKNTIVGTQDMELKRRLKEKSVKLLVIRQKKYFILS